VLKGREIVNNLPSYLRDGLHTLYAQSLGITLAPPVLPRRLARELAGACSPINHDLRKCYLIIRRFTPTSLPVKIHYEVKR
jgi:hypothetical protein